jgi:hypothetical protein
VKSRPDDYYKYPPGKPILGGDALWYRWKTTYANVRTIPPQQNGPCTTLVDAALKRPPDMLISHIDPAASHTDIVVLVLHMYEVIFAKPTKFPATSIK